MIQLDEQRNTKGIVEFSDTHIAKTDRIIVSDESEIDFFNCVQKHPDDKPEGLWYALGDVWIHYCFIKQGFDLEPEKNHLHKILIAEDRVLILDNISDLEEFSDEYGTFSAIDWKSVALDYDGIEIKDINIGKPNCFKPTWYFTWSVDSGVIWNARAVKTIKQIGYFNGSVFVTS